MSRIAALCLSVSLLFPLAAQARAGGIGWHLESAERGKVQLSLSRDRNGGRDRDSNDWAPQELQGLGANPYANGTDVSFRIVRLAGVLACEGRGRGGHAEGDCRFNRDTAYFESLRTRGVSVTDEWLAWQLARFDVPLALLDELRRLGYETPSARDLISAGIFKIDVAFLRALHGAGYRLENVRALVPLRIHGVDAAYIRDLKAANPRLQLGPQELVNFRIHGVTPQWVAGWTQLGYNLSAIQLTNTRIHGASPDYARAMLAEVRDRPTIDQFIAMRIHGVRPGNR